MRNKRDAWGDISWNEHEELKYFCRQYAQKKREADAMLTLRISTPPVPVDADGNGVLLPHGSGGISDPVAMAAARREKLLDDVRMIERAAVMAGQDLAPYLLKCVTCKGGIRSILAECPASERSIYNMRRRFFYILKQMRDQRGV